jgi:hypothetical protein
VLTLNTEDHNLDVQILSGVNCFPFIFLQGVNTVRGNLNRSVSCFM